MNRISRQKPKTPAGIVHLGLGAFSRAHLALLTDDALKNAGGDWGIIGVSLRSPNVRDSLTAQQFAYTAVQLDREQSTCRQVETINDVLVAPEDPHAVLQQMALPAIKIVSLTVTEKGYCLSPSSGELNLQHPDIVHDTTSSLPVSAPGFLVHALKARMHAGHLPFTVLSCDNVPDNGNTIRHVVLTLAEQIDNNLMVWIKEHGCFPSTMVDRITPATTPDDLQMVENLTNKIDTAPVMHEPYCQWVIENSFVNGEHPDWASAGAQIVSDVRPFELMKLRMLNGTHSALAYLGCLAGFKTISETVADKDFRCFTETLWEKEIIPSLATPPGVSLSDYARVLMVRYTNPNVRHLNSQIAIDGSQKLPQRILGTLDDRFAEGAQTPGLALTVAAWMRYLRGTDEAGNPIDIRDPLAEKFISLAKTTNEPEDWVASILAIREIFPDAVANSLLETVTKTYRQLLEHGAHGMVRRIVKQHLD